MNTTIQFRTNEKIKKEAIKVFKKEGITMSCAFNAFLEEVAYKGSLPVKVYPSQKVPAPVIRHWREQMKIDIKTQKGFKNAGEFLKYIENLK